MKYTAKSCIQVSPSLQLKLWYRELHTVCFRHRRQLSSCTHRYNYSQAGSCLGGQASSEPRTVPAQLRLIYRQAGIAGSTLTLNRCGYASEWSQSVDVSLYRPSMATDAAHTLYFILPFILYTLYYRPSMATDAAAAGVLYTGLKAGAILCFIRLYAGLEAGGIYPL